VTELCFLPGAGGRASFWRPVAERLAPRWPGRLVGYPGFAGEPADPAVGSLAGLLGWLRARMPPGRCHLVAQSMGGVLAVQLALEAPERVASLVLAATSGGVDVAALGGADWRPEYRRELPEVPDWFEVDRTDLTARLGELAVPTLVLHSDADPICPPAVARLLCSRIPGARAVCVQGGSHMFGEERPDEVAAAIREHLERCGLVSSRGP
jgi:poly(3-hydroxyoctanoate) depolymerase